MPELLRRIFRPRPQRALLRIPPPLRPIFTAAETAARNYALLHKAAMARERRQIDKR